MKRCHLLAPLLSLAILASTPALAAPCGPDTLGTSRTITLKRGAGGAWGARQHVALPDLKPGEVVLTFDDGPARGLTEKVLDALKAQCAHATFFMTGANLERNPDLARRVVAEGHSAGIHSYSHPHMKSLTEAAQLDDLARTQAAYRKVFLHPSPAYRFPFLEETPALLSALEQDGMAVFSIDLDITDWQPADTTDMLAARLETKLAEAGGGIILLHDANPPTADAIAVLLRVIKDKGYRLVHLHWAD